MKSYFNFLFSILFILSSAPSFAQIGIGTTTPAPSAALEVSSLGNNKGILIPRISATQKDAIVKPAEGLLIYQTTAPSGFYYYEGTSWKWIANTTDIGLVGNAATATKLATARNINGVAFDNSIDITVPAAAATLTGTTLNSTVIGSSLTSVGTLTNLTVTNPIVGSVTGNAGTSTKLSASKNINGVAFDGSTDIIVPTVTSISALTLGSSGIDLSSTVANGTTTPVITLNVPTASGTNRGALSSADWTTFNGKQNTITLTTTGTSGAATFASNTINIPNYGSTFSGYVPYKGATDSVNLGAFDLTVNSLRVGRGGGGIATNTAIGNAPLFANTTGSRNTAIGNNSLYTNTVGYNNTAIGANALFANIDGDLNTATGISALEDNTTGNSNTATGLFALGDNTSGSSNTAIGQGALRKNTTATYNTAIGFNSLSANIDGYNNTATGVNALAANTSGYFNTATGVNALGDNKTGVSNTAVGLFALGANTIGRLNTATGQSALRYSTLSSYNTAIGYLALENTGKGEIGSVFTNGVNTAIGYSAGSANTTGTFNTFLGSYTSTLGNLTNATAIGNGASVSASNTIQLGNTAVKYVETSGIVKVAGVTLTSDLRLKTNVVPISVGLNSIMQLKPVSYEKKSSLSSTNYSIKENGFIAQELQKVMPSLVIEGTDKDKLLSVNYTALIPVLTKAIQEQQKAIQAQQKQIEELKLLILSMKK